MAVTPLLVEQMRAALDAHDLDAFVDFFHEDYLGERPRHPDAPPSTREEVRENWTEVLRDVPDLRVEIPAAVQEGDTIERVARLRDVAERCGARAPGSLHLRRARRACGLVPNVLRAR